MVEGSACKLPYRLVLGGAMSQVRRRQCLVAAAMILATPFADAQGSRTYRIGGITLPMAEDKKLPISFRTAMQNLGYVEGRNIVFETRPVDRDMRTLPAMVDELLASKPDVLIGTETVARVMRAKTTTIPIVLTNALDPVRAGLAESLRRPGLNVTGNAQLNDLLPPKHVEIMREILPRLRRIGQLVDTTQSNCAVIEEAVGLAAQRIGATLVSYRIQNREDLERAFAQMETERPDVLLPCPTDMLFNHRNFLIENVLRLRIAYSSFIVGDLPPGVLFAYAASIPDLQRKAAAYVDKILKGAKPGDLPIEQPTKFELVVNLKTARAIGLAIPPSIRLRLDRVVE